MFEKRGLSKAQFAQSGYDTSAYRFIETEGTFNATLDLKVWGDSMLKNFLTLEDGRTGSAFTTMQLWQIEIDMIHKINFDSIYRQDLDFDLYNNLPVCTEEHCPIF